MNQDGEIVRISRKEYTQIYPRPGWVEHDPDEIIDSQTVVLRECGAGLAVGFWKSQAEIAGMWRLDRRFEPRMARDERERLLHGWRRAVERAKAWAED